MLVVQLLPDLKWHAVGKADFIIRGVARKKRKRIIC